MISLLPVHIFDLFFRFGAVGLLFTLLFLLNDNANKSQRFAAQSLVICIAGYVLLTAPIENYHYGWLRQPLLLFTDLTPFAIFWLAQAQLLTTVVVNVWRKIIALAMISWCLFLAYFFLMTDGRGAIHDLAHLVGLIVLLYVVVICLLGYMDDLVNSRRNFRLAVIITSSCYMVLLTLVELVFSVIKDEWLFSLLNALLIFILCLGVLLKRVQLRNGNTGVQNTQDAVDIDGTGAPELTQGLSNSRLTALNALMGSGFYQQSDLTIGKLADELALPAHLMRKLINKELGYNNFSHYLNSYRIPAICKQLADPALKQTPILTLALDMGFGSIASFNRAFKQQMQITPSNYRDQF